VASGLKFNWDPRKAIANKAKLGVSFEEASQVFGDKIAITIQDPDRGSENEYREITIGTSGKLRIVVVAHITDGNLVRIISARKAGSSELQQYNEG
jgi:uncharacterized DUF497 family protein